MVSAEPETVDSAAEIALGALEANAIDADVDPLLLALLGPLVDRYGIVETLDALSQLSALGAQAYPADAEFWADASIRLEELANALADEDEVEEGAES